MSRIEQAMEARGLNKNKLANRLGLTPQAVGEWFSKGKEPSAETMQKLPGALECSGHWLLTGDGPMQTTPESEAQIRLAAVRIALERDVAALVRDASERVVRVERGQHPGQGDLDLAGGDDPGT